MMDNSKNEDYGKSSCNRVKFNFVDDQHPRLTLLCPPKPSSNDNDKGKKSNIKDKVHFPVCGQIFVRGS